MTPGSDAIGVRTKVCGTLSSKQHPEENLSLEHLAWPAVALIAIVFALIYYKAPLTRLLDRTRSLSTKGLDASLPEPSPEAKQKQEGGANHAEWILEDLQGTTVIRLREAELAQALRLDTMPPEKAKEVLLRALASQSLSFEYERIHDLVFGSQLNLLWRLRQTAPVGIPMNDVAAYFQGVRNNHAQAFAEWDVDQYLRFLIHSALLKTANGHVILTEKGADYLVWIARMAKNLERPY